MKRHGIGQGAIAVKDVSGVLFFGRSKYCHSREPGDSCTCSNRSQLVPGKGAAQNFY
jgi:hypothetical protein